MASPPQSDTLPALYHRSARAEVSADVRQFARLGFQVSTYRSEACLWLGLTHLQAQQFSTAFLHLALALEQQAGQATLHALVVRCLQQQGLLNQALSALEAGLIHHPTDRVLRQQQVPLLLAMHDKGLLKKATLLTRLQCGLPDITDPQELRQTLDALHTHANPAEVQGTAQHLIGAVWHDPVQQHIGGWVIDLSAPSRPLEVEVELPHRGQLACLRLAAKSPNPLLQAAYGIAHGGFRAQLPQAIDALIVRCADGPQLIGSPLAAVPVFMPAPAPAEVKATPHKQPIDILVPVFKGRQATLDCIDSVIRHAARNRSPHRLIVLDDASPDEELVVALKKRARQGKLQYLRHPANLGFIRNMNRGMALHPERDIVWLNADTRVHGDWLDRLRSAAYSAEDIASVTPFSNNGELMSFPRMRHAADMPTPQAHAELDDAARRVGLTAVPLETGCGFCLYIKRRALDDVGYLDEVELKRGYGEETDWCLRAQAKGWRHVGAVNLFVAHAGGHSFGREKAIRVFQNNAVLRRRYPDAERNFQRYVAADPLAPARQQLAAALHHTPAHAAQDWLDNAQDDTRPSAPRPSSAASPPQAPSFTATLWRIADALDHRTSHAIPRRWLQLARHLARLRRHQQPAPLLLFDQDSPWEIELMATGQVLKLPHVRGLSHQDILTACGNPADISLAGETSPDWLASLLSADAGTAHPARTAATS